jgi:hypothetical protein
MSSAYRSPYQHIIGMRLAEMRRARAMVEPHVPDLRSVGHARIARILAGAVGIAGACAMIVFACLGDEAGATYALLASSSGMAGTYVLARVALAIAGVTTRSLLDENATPRPRLTGQLDADLAQLEAIDPIRAIERRLARLEVWSTALPLAALSLFMPLTLHYGIGWLMGPESPETYGSWIRFSLLIVGHAHLALMALAIAFARKISRTPQPELAAMSIHGEWLKAWGVTVAVSSLPGILLFLIPPVLTAVTGLAFIPLMFVLARRRVLKERAMMGLAQAASMVRVAPGELDPPNESDLWLDPHLPEEAPATLARM